MIKNQIKRIVPFFDIFLLPLIYPAALLMKTVRRIGMRNLPRCRNALLKVGIFPIRNHYYEPQFDNRDLNFSDSSNRSLPGINWNIEGQLSFLSFLKFSEELMRMPHEKRFEGCAEFYLNNGSFESGDAEYWYQIIRYIKPRKIIEVGSGNSTKVAMQAIKKNIEDDSSYRCRHMCIEPYEQTWLEGSTVELYRKKVEEIDTEFFLQLESGDVLFIDSSHIIRPDGDILKEQLEIFPSLKSGVIVHIHDIFSPKNYLCKWLLEDVKFWNEQYLLEAFLTHNNDWKVLGALNYLHHNHYLELKKVAPHLNEHREPGSFYMVKK